jgi:hypothetical protein
MKRSNVAEAEVDSLTGGRAPKIEQVMKNSTTDENGEENNLYATAMRHAIERMHAMTEKNRQDHVRWESLRSKLGKIENSREYKMLCRLHGYRDAVLPSGSFRRKIGDVGFQAARWLGRLWSRSAASSSTTVGPCENKSDSNAGGCPAPPPEPSELDYHPDRWALEKATSDDAQFLKLMILSPVHRTGSTLLQRICNSRQGTLIWGEHGGTLGNFADIFTCAAYFAVMGAGERDAYFGQEEKNSNLWIASMCPDLNCVRQAVVAAARAFLNSLYGQYRSSHDILGFKEVHYGGNELALLRHCYPNADFLLLIRNPLHAWKSTWRTAYPTLEYWISKYKSGLIAFRDCAKIDPHCHLIRYEDLIHHEKKTLDAVADVAKVSRQQMAMVLAHKVGATKGSDLDPGERTVICRELRDIMKEFDYR